jgi:hypothetical protein
MHAWKVLERRNQKPKKPRLNRYLHPYWPVVLSNVAIPLEKLPSTGVEAWKLM